jgi:hypothetical protein
MPRPHRLEAQDTSLSRRRHRFESGWGYAYTHRLYMLEHCASP